ncbi:hypothetical protein [Winogradskyella poriferorum]|uniref:hypothetical protein n=1 Tax=Winogradskyella poriferorum TaxID=307627 RepID=UPI003D654804
MKIKALNPLSFGKFQAVMGLIIGLVCGIIYAFGGLIIDTLVTLELITSNETPGLSIGTFLAFGALIGMPLIGVFFGFLAGIIQAFVYNMFTKHFGQLTL